ncbi:uncharacterized protein LOC111105682 isoform X2 [Crassostrea virginica]
MRLLVLVIFELFYFGGSYIVSDKEQPVCPFVRCQNGGQINLTTCHCDCPSKYYGFFCDNTYKKSMWPDGTYALPASMFGCPETEDRGWSLSFVNLTLPDSADKQEWNMKDPSFLNNIIEPNILGPYYYRALQMNFCVKEDSNVEEEGNRTSIEWPRGQYCIYGFNNACPEEFINGTLTINGYLFSDQDFGGRIPGESGGNHTLLLHFCCRQDGDYGTPIKLPSDFPFVLFQDESADGCQEVESMISQRDFFYMTNQNDDWMFEGALPKFDTTTLNNSVGVAFCYYKPDKGRDCYYESDLGNSYNGRANTTATGRVCLSWAGSPNAFYKNDRKAFHEFDVNYCRAYEYWDYKSREPLCIVEYPDVLRSCGVPKCDEDKDLQIYGKYKPYKSVPPYGTQVAENALDGIVGGVSFVSERPVLKPWFQINLQEYVEVHAILIHRIATYFPNNLRYLGTYVSKNQWDFMNYGAVRCDDLRFPGHSMVFRYQCRRPVLGQYVTIRDFDFTHPYSNPGKFFRMEINEIVILGKSSGCGRPLGMASGNIYDYQLSSSSDDAEGDVVDSMALSQRGRLFYPNPGWCSKQGDTEPWFLIDLLAPTSVQGVSVQGWVSGQDRKFIHSFRVSYGTTGSDLKYYEDSPGIVKTFVIDPNVAVVTPQTFVFHREILTRYIKIYPTAHNDQQACLKAEVIGCQKQLHRDAHCGEGITADFGFEELLRYSFWLEGSLSSSFNKSTIEECRGFCLKHNCTSLYFMDYADKKTCTLYEGDRYHPTRRSAWVITGSELNYASHRLCFKNAMDVHMCNFFINLTQDGEAVIRSPGFPFSYGQGLNCTWTIDAGPSKFVKLEIIYVYLAKTITQVELKELGMFDVNSGKCSDRIIIRDDSNTLEITAETQGDFRDSVIIATGSTVTVSLESCFQLSTEILEKIFEVKATKSDKPGCGMTKDGCTVRCQVPSAYIATNRYPSPYQPGERCIWRIDGKFGQFVQLNILNIDVINGGQSCASSYIAVYDIDLSHKERLLGRYCKENRPHSVIRSMWHHMRVEFRAASDQKEGTGFLAEYSFVEFSQNFTSDLHEDCPDGWQHNNHSCYKIFTNDVGITWPEADRKCNQQNGSLVSIASKQELEYVHHLVTNSLDLIWDKQMFIGLRKVYLQNEKELQYMWSDGNPLTFTAWFRDDVIKDRQPNGVYNEKCTSINFFSIYSMNDWHDTACAYDHIRSYMCELDIGFRMDNISRINWWSNGTTLKGPASGVGLFVCNNTEQINTVFVCDGLADCSDASDEDNCSTECSERQFRCTDGSCISISLLCDFVSHCADGSDESGCVRQRCNQSEWMCASGQCIPDSQYCDMKRDCFDSSDEQQCEDCRHGFECYDQTCLHPSKVCDGFIDCNGFFAEDESQNCENNVRESCQDWWSLGRRQDGEYLVSLGLTGQTPAKVGCKFQTKDSQVLVQTIIHHSQEETIVSPLDVNSIDVHYQATDKQISNLKLTNKCRQGLRMRCHYTNVLTDAMWEADDGRQFHTSEGKKDPDCSCPFVNKCEKGKTKCNCNSTLGEWFRAEFTQVREDAGVITDHSLLPIRKMSLTDPGLEKFIKMDIGPLVCSDETDFVNRDFLCRSGRTIPVSMRCILDYDVYDDVKGCRDLSHLDDCEFTQCPPGYLKCPRSFCIPPRFICDGQKHCQYGVDELMCGSCPGLFRCRNSSICLDPERLCDGVPNCPHRDDELMCNVTFPEECECHDLSGVCRYLQNTSIIKLPKELRYLKMSENDFQHGLPALKHMTNLVVLLLNDCRITSIESYAFNRQRNLLELDLSHNRIRYIYPYAFTGLESLKLLNLKGNPLLVKISDMAFLGLYKLPEIDLSSFRLQDIGANTLTGLDNVRELNLSSNNIRFVTDFAFRNMTEMTTLDLRGNKIDQFSANIFFGLSKLKRLYTDSYAFCCLKPSSVEVCLPNPNEFSSCDDLMKNELLSSFLWIIGFSSLLGNLGVFIFKIFFDSATLKKGHGIFITNLSISDFLMGVYLIIIASADTHYSGRYVWNDLQWRTSLTCRFAGMLATISSETSVFLLCLITMDRLIAVKFPFGQFRFTRGKALVCVGVVWGVTLMLAVIPLISGSYFQGEFYSRSVVCLALPLTRDRPAGWEYSTAIFIILNFMLFLTMALGQCLIYREIVQTASNVKSTRRSQDMVIARGLFLVVLSDFLCWFPIGIMGLLAISGQVISGEVYAWVAVFILPINSALNPFLYSFANLRKKVETRLSSSKQSQLSRTTTETFAELCDNELFIIGKHAPLFVTLADHMKKHTLSVAEMRLVVSRLAEAMNVLHEHDLVHGCLDTNLVSLDIVDGKIKDLAVKIVPKDAVDDEDIPNDIRHLGELTFTMLRNNKRNSTDTSNTSC